jgi:hypothetical protein
VEWCVAGPSELIGPSNFFELAVATAIAHFGFRSGAALSTVCAGNQQQSMVVTNPTSPILAGLGRGFACRSARARSPDVSNLWKYQRGWLEAIGDPLTPRVTLMEAARLGFSKCLIATIGSYACNDPCSVILLVPTDDVARRYAVDEVEPSFEESPALHDLIQRGRLDGRNTLVMKAFNATGSLKILAASIA